MFRVAVGRVIVEHGGGPTCVRRDRFTDVSREAKHPVAVVCRVGGHLGQGGHHHIGQILLLPTHGAGPQGLHVDASVPFDDVASGGDFGADGRKVRGPVPAQFHHAGVVFDDDVHTVLARPIRVFHPRGEGAFDTNHFVGVFDQVADAHHVWLAHHGVSVHAGHKQNRDAKHRPQTLTHHEVWGRARFHHDVPSCRRGKSVPPKPSDVG